MQDLTGKLKLKETMGWTKAEIEKAENALDVVKKVEEEIKLTLDEVKSESPKGEDLIYSCSLPNSLQLITDVDQLGL